jgi:hypothetical protein
MAVLWGHRAALLVANARVSLIPTTKDRHATTYFPILSITNIAYSGHPSLGRRLPAGLVHSISA